jgi:predicted nucleic acid-binding protein
MLMTWRAWWARLKTRDGALAICALLIAAVVSVKKIRKVARRRPRSLAERIRQGKSAGKLTIAITAAKLKPETIRISSKETV